MRRSSRSSAGDCARGATIAAATAIATSAALMRGAIGEPLEEAGVVPLRPIRPVGDADRQIAHHLDVLAGRGAIDRLIQSSDGAW